VTGLGELSPHFSVFGFFSEKYRPKINLNELQILVTICFLNFPNFDQ
jgi:hypothetical protein